MAPRRSKTQKEGLINARAHRHQDGGSDSLDLTQDDQPVVNPELQRAQTKAENALVIIEAQLQAELAHSKELYRSLRVERQKVTRTKAAKANAEADAAAAKEALGELEEQMEQLTLRNEQLKLSISQLLENWATEAKIAKEQLQECYSKIKVLQEKCRQAPEILTKAVERAKVEGQKFSLIEKGVYTDEA